LVINALDIIGETAKAMGKPFDKYCKTLVGPVAGCLSDQKIQVRTAAFNSLTSIKEASDLESMLPGIGAALVPENSVQRKDLSKWLADNLELAKDKLPDLSPLVSPLISCLQDKNSDVRKQAQSCLKFVVQSVGFAPIKEKASSLKGASLQSVMPLIDSLRSEGPSPSVGGKPASSTLRPPSALGSRQLSSGPPSRPDSAADVNAKKKAPLLGKRPPTATSSSLSRSNSNAPPSAPAFPILQTDSRSKDQRIAREKPARWIFDSVPSDIIASVQEQSTNSFSSELRKSMFSTDHYKDKEYMNAVNTLYDIITCPEYDSLDKYQIEYNDLVDRVLFTSDLIIKYLTIRIHDSATTLCFRCLETMESLLQLLSTTGYSLPDNEAAIFFPAIISKMGDSKEAMKTKVSATFKQIYSLYPLNKSFVQIMDIGLKSKNAKVRAECLDELAKLIKQNDVSVCNPSKSMPIIAKHIADRDAGVRTGAINVIAEVYILTGDAVYKYLGRIGEKEKSYLDERFKRITPNVTPSVEPSKLPENTGTHIFSFQRKDSIQQDHISPPLPNATPTSISPIQSPQRSDYPEYSPIMAHTTIPPQPSPRNRTSFTPSLVSPGIPKSIPPTDHSNNSISLEMSRLDLPQVPNNGQSNIPALSPYSNSYSKQQERYGLIPTNSVMERLGDQISDPDISLSLEGLREFESQISGGYEVISPYLNNIVIAISKKVRSLNTSPIPEDSPHFARLIKYLVNSLVQIFSTSELARNIDETALHDLINQILIMLEISKTSSSETFVGFSRALNILMVRILDHCCPNSAFRCMFTLLQQLYNPNHVMEVELSEHSMLSLSEMICKCIAKLNRSIGPKLASQELDPQVLLYDINTLLIGVPRDYLINPNGYPEFKEVYRMVKTVIYDLLQVLKNDFFTKFGVIEEHNQHNLVLVLSNRLIETRRRSIKRKSMINAQT
jgi:cytoskeleton-associated protein 5